MKKKTGIIIAAVVVACGCAFGGWMYHSAQIDKMRNAGIETLHEGVVMDDYRDEQQEEMNAIFKKSEAEIMEAKDQESVDKINADAGKQIAEVKTDAQLDIEEGIETLEGSVKLKDYRDEQKKEVKKILKKAKKSIESAEDQKAIDKALKKAKNDIAEIKTDAQLTAEEEAAAEAARQAAAAAAARANKSSGKKKSSGSSNSGGCVGNDASNFY